MYTLCNLFLYVYLRLICNHFWPLCGQPCWAPLFSVSTLNASTIYGLRYVWSVSSRPSPLWLQITACMFLHKVSISCDVLNLKQQCTALLVDGCILVIHKVIGSSQLQIWRNFHWWNFPPKVILNIWVSIKKLSKFYRFPFEYHLINGLRHNFHVTIGNNCMLDKWHSTI